MKSKLNRHALAVATAAVLLAGCGAVTRPISGVDGDANPVTGALTFSAWDGGGDARIALADGAVCTARWPGSMQLRTELVANVYCDDGRHGEVLAQLITVDGVGSADLRLVDGYRATLRHGAPPPPP
jgi:hypothetical protein